MLQAAARAIIRLLMQSDGAAASMVRGGTFRARTCQQFKLIRRCCLRRLCVRCVQARTERALADCAVILKNLEADLQGVTAPNAREDPQRQLQECSDLREDLARRLQAPVAPSTAAGVERDLQELQQRVEAVRAALGAVPAYARKTPETVRVYVPPPEFQAVMELLIQQKPVLLTGSPGLGKSAMTRELEVSYHRVRIPHACYAVNCCSGIFQFAAERHAQTLVCVYAAHWGKPLLI